MQSSFIFNPQEGVEGEDIKAWTQATLAFWACNFIFPSFPSSPNQLLQLSRCLPSGQYAGKLASKAVINLSPLPSWHRILLRSEESQLRALQNTSGSSHSHAFQAPTGPRCLPSLRQKGHHERDGEGVKPKETQAQKSTEKEDG